MPYLEATTTPQKVANLTKLHWLVVQIFTGTIRFGRDDQELKVGGGFAIRAASEANYEAIFDANYEGYWRGNLWVMLDSTATAARYHYEAHAISDTATATTLPAR